MGPISKGRRETRRCVAHKFALYGTCHFNLGPTIIPKGPKCFYSLCPTDHHHAHQSLFHHPHLPINMNILFLFLFIFKSILKELIIFHSVGYDENLYMGILKSVIGSFFIHPFLKFLLQLFFHGISFFFLTIFPILGKTTVNNLQPQVSQN